MCVVCLKDGKNQYAWFQSIALICCDMCSYSEAHEEILLLTSSVEFAQKKSITFIKDEWFNMQQAEEYLIAKKTDWIRECELAIAGKYVLSSIKCFICKLISLKQIAIIYMFGLFIRIGFENQYSPWKAFFPAWTVSKRSGNAERTMNDR